MPGEEILTTAAQGWTGPEAALFGALCAVVAGVFWFCNRTANTLDRHLKECSQRRVEASRDAANQRVEVYAAIEEQAKVGREDVRQLHQKLDETNRVLGSIHAEVAGVVGRLSARESGEH